MSTQNGVKEIGRSKFEYGPKKFTNNCIKNYENTDELHCNQQ